MKILTVVGARPQFIKAAAVSREIRKEFKEYLVHTGQHYDTNMSKVFFDELHIPEPDINLSVGSGSHAVQTAEMMVKLEAVINEQKPDMVLLYGDTNSTLAGAIVAAKLNIPIAHVEAGVRCNVKDMPEEQNRIMTDHLAKWNFAPSQEGMNGLMQEGLGETAFFVGDVMYDALLYYGELVKGWSVENFRSKLEGLEENEKIKNLGLDNGWYLCTIHRPENTDKICKFDSIMEGLNQLDKPVIFPVHPRTQKNLSVEKMQKWGNIYFVKPLGYMEMIYASKNACKVVTDSGGLHKECYLLKTPGIVVLRNTGWSETLKGNWNVLANPEERDIVEKVMKTVVNKECWKTYYGDGQAAKKIVGVLKKTFCTKMEV